MKRLRQAIQNKYILTALIIMIAVVATGMYKIVYPYGARPCCLPCVLQALQEFAAAHDGNFPGGGKNPREALSKLYPEYLPDQSLLAGISGDRKLLKREMSENLEITENASSWVYWPGFGLNDTPEIAIIWESKAGLRFNGMRGSGHAVGFIRGGFQQVPDSDWAFFLKKQDLLRQQSTEKGVTYKVKGSVLENDNFTSDGG